MEMTAAVETCGGDGPAFLAPRLIRAKLSQILLAIRRAALATRSFRAYTTRNTVAPSLSVSVFRSDERFLEKRRSYCVACCRHLKRHGVPESP